MFIVVQVFAKPQLPEVATAYLLADSEVGAHHKDRGGGGGPRPGGHIGPGSATCLGNSEKNTNFNILTE